MRSNNGLQVPNMEKALFTDVSNNTTIDTMATINQLLVHIKTANHAIPPLLRKHQYDMEQLIGYENEYTINSLLSITDSLVIQLLTMTARRHQFLRQTSYTERKNIQNQLSQLHNCLSETLEILQNTETLNTAIPDLPLLEAPLFIDALKPYSRMIELITAQERIHALSAVLENLLSREYKISEPVDDCELSDEQQSALELSHFLVKQAL